MLLFLIRICVDRPAICLIMLWRAESISHVRLRLCTVGPWFDSMVFRFRFIRMQQSKRDSFCLLLKREYSRWILIITIISIWSFPNGLLRYQERRGLQESPVHGKGRRLQEWTVSWKSKVFLHHSYQPPHSRIGAVLEGVWPENVYLTTKQIGKNNLKAAEIKADNVARQDWNRTTDMALVSGIAESKIIEIRNEHV